MWQVQTYGSPLPGVIVRVRWRQWQVYAERPPAIRREGNVVGPGPRQWHPAGS